MLAHGNQDVVRFRATWRGGEGYRAGDVVARGVRSYQALKRHTSGSQSEPGHGEQWAEFWEVYDPDAALHPIHRQQLAVVQSLPPATDIEPLSIDRPAPRMPSAAPAAAVPAVVRRDEPLLASEIVDDSGEAGMNVAFALDALRQHLKQITAQLALRSPGDGASGDPLLAELWRRKCAVLGAADRAECEAMMQAAMWDWMRLIRKQQRGEVWNADEVRRNAILEAVDQRFLELDRAYEGLRGDPPLDAEHDRHWRGP